MQIVHWGLQVNREAKIDCALAELYTKSLATEQMLQEQKQAEVLTKLYVRMNEVFLLSESLSSSCCIVLPHCLECPHRCTVSIAQ